MPLHLNIRRLKKQCLIIFLSSAFQYAQVYCFVERFPRLRLLILLVRIVLWQKCVAHWWNGTEGVKPKYSKQTLSQWHFVHHIILHGLARGVYRTSAVLKTWINLYVYNDSVPAAQRTKCHCITKINMWMPYEEIMPFCGNYTTCHKNTFVGKNAVFVVWNLSIHTSIQNISL